MKYLFALMDDETRFWIAQEVAETKYKHDARRLFQLGVKATGKNPMKLITDGLPAYHLAYMKEFWTQRYPRTEHSARIWHGTCLVMPKKTKEQFWGKQSGFKECWLLSLSDLLFSY